MSSRLAMRVLESNLPASLKPVTVVMALHATDEGFKIFPSVDRVAWLLSISARAVQAKFEKLRALGVLIPLTPLTGGRRRVVHYQLQLPLTFDRPSWQEQLRSSLHRFVKGEASFAVSAERVKLGAQTTKLDAERVKLDAQKGEASFTRSLRDHKEEQKEEIAQPAELPEGTQPPRVSFLDRIRQTHPDLASTFERGKTIAS